jgi:ferritin-like metal-binding protein YciE
MKEPLTRKNGVIDKLLEDTHHMLAACDVPHLRDQLAAGCIQNINAYKVTTYQTAYMFAVELELDTVADIVQQILEWEMINKKVLAELAIELFNNSQQSASN